MLYYEFSWQTSDKKWHTTNCEPQERGDQVDYLTEGQRAGWVLQWNCKAVEEEW